MSAVQSLQPASAGLEQLPVAGSHVPATWHWSRAVQVTGLLPTQLPLWQVSVCVQALASLQGVPFVAVGVEQLPVAGLHVPATWHWSRAVQVTGLLPTQLPLWQVSVCVQALASLQGVPFVAVGVEQLPVAGLHVPATWHWSRAVQVTGLLPTQLPLWQVSVCVQALASLQGVPFVAVGVEQLPVAGLHVPATWHWSRAVQVTGLLPTQLPFWQVSVCVQALASLQGVPFVAAGLEQLPVAGLHVPATWHWSRAVQVTGLLPTQLPLWQVSVCVQALASLPGFPFVAVGLELLPVAARRASDLWHWSRAVQVTGLLPTQLPLWQVSVCVQALPSVQGVPSALAGLLQAPVTGSQVPAVWHWSEAVHTTGIGVFWQTPALQESVVQAFPSLQSAAVVQSLQPAMGVLEQKPALQESAVQGFRSLQSAAVEQIGWTVTQPSPESPPVLV